MVSTIYINVFMPYCCPIFIQYLQDHDVQKDVNTNVYGVITTFMKIKRKSRCCQGIFINEYNPYKPQ